MTQVGNFTVVRVQNGGKWRFEYRPPTTARSDWAQLSGALRIAAQDADAALKGQGKINYGMGSFDNEQTLVMGTAWVGPNYRITSKGLWESSDGLRQFRPPTYKPQLGKFQANFEQRLPNQSKWGSNGHVDVVD
jgi:filamentous hemagglutinin